MQLQDFCFFSFRVGEQIFSPFREILQEIQRLRLEHEQASQPTPEKAQQNPTLLTELRLLRYRQPVALSVNCGSFCLEHD